MAKQYDPLKVTGGWATINPLIGTVDIKEGAVDGEFLSTARDNPNWTREHDQAGNTTRVRNHHKGGTLPITISASSALNDILSRAVFLDEQTSDVIGDIEVEDLNGTTKIIATDACLAGPPDPRFGANRGEHTWIFECGSIDIFLGGHNVVTAS